MERKRGGDGVAGRERRFKRTCPKTRSIPKTRKANAGAFQHFWIDVKQLNGADFAGGQDCFGKRARAGAEIDDEIGGDGRNLSGRDAEHGFVSRKEAADGLIVIGDVQTQMTAHGMG